MEHIPDYELCMLSKAQEQIAELEKKLAGTQEALARSIDVGVMLEKKLEEANHHFDVLKDDWQAGEDLQIGLSAKLAIAVEALREIRQEDWGTDQCDYKNMVADAALDALKEKL